MNIYLLSQTVNDGYDTHDSIIVCAESEELAKKIHPYFSEPWYKEDWFNQSMYGDTWALPKDIKCELIGTSLSDKPQMILASFNAG
jgi:hypothetical protein